MNGRASGGPRVLGVRDWQEQCLVSCTYYKSKQVNRYKLARKIISLP